MSFEIFRFSVLRPPEFKSDAEIIEPPLVQTNTDGQSTLIDDVLSGEMDSSLAITDDNKRLEHALSVALTQNDIEAANKIGRDILRERESVSNLLVVKRPTTAFTSILAITTDVAIPDDTEVDEIEIKSHPAFRPVGVSDLYTIEQTLLCYEPSEISHIENVLTGEKRERTHVSLKETEITDVEQFSSEITDEHSLITEERFELNEAFKSATQNEMSLNTSVEAKASYGPTVEVKAGVQFGMSRAKQTSRETASQFARTATEKAVKKTVEKASSSRTERRLSRTTHTNFHGFDNTKGNEHVLGVYQYLDKVYRCELLNHGPRFFYELIIPSPGKSLRPNQEKRGNTNPDLPLKPQPPRWKSASDVEIRTYLAEFPYYDGGEAPEPPPGRKIVSTDTMSDKDGGGDGAQNFAVIDKIDIPDGYVTDHAIVQMLLYQRHRVAPGYHVRIGNAVAERSRGSVDFRDPETLGEPDNHVRLNDIHPYRGSISYAINIVHDGRAFIAIDLVCEPAPEVLQQWRNEVFGLAWQNYRDALSAWNELNEPEEDFFSLSMEPVERDTSLRDRERVELKRQALEIISKMSEVFHETGNLGTTPLVVERSEFPVAGSTGRLNTVDVERLGQFAKEVTFAENAFEWSGMMWDLYPYYWHPREEWDQILGLTHSDSQREVFLQSGAARVLLPIKPGFEDEVHAFLYRGLEALGTETDVVLTSENLVHLAAEIQEAKQRRKSDDENAYPIKEDEWLARVPTELVALRVEKGLPTCPPEVQQHHEADKDSVSEEPALDTNTEPDAVTDAVDAAEDIETQTPDCDT